MHRRSTYYETAPQFFLEMLNHSHRIQWSCDLCVWDTVEAGAVGFALYKLWTWQIHTGLWSQWTSSLFHIIRGPQVLLVLCDNGWLFYVFHLNNIKVNSGNTASSYKSCTRICLGMNWLAMTRFIILDDPAFSYGNPLHWHLCCDSSALL